MGNDFAENGNGRGMIGANRADGIQHSSGVNPSAVALERGFSPKSAAPRPMTVDEMSERLEDAGFSYSKTDATRFILGRFSYQHLSSYIPLFDSEPCDIKRDVRSLYLVMKLDRMFQSVLMEYIGLFEHQLRARYSLELSLKGGAFAHRDPSCFVNQGYFDSFLREYGQVVRSCMKQSRSRAKRDIEKYGDMPVWEAIEEMPLGMVSKLYMNTASPGVKKRVARSFGSRPREFENMMSSIAFVRNRCAHFGKLLGETLARRPPKLEYVEADNGNPFYIALVLMYLLRTNNGFGEMSLMPSATLATSILNLMESHRGLLRTAKVPDDWDELVRDPNVHGLDLQIAGHDGTEDDARVRKSMLKTKMT